MGIGWMQYGNQVGVKWELGMGLGTSSIEWSKYEMEIR